ncbi:hypothetical protein [Streptomyces sp. NPDC048248]|uniref:hypothetical protein n=1 Tax=Streptomyces sp. NPDC048248 TaxID=3365523 RepID=UPI00371765B8
MSMSPARARATRLPQLADDVRAGARCSRPEAPAADQWFRRDGENGTVWALRRAALIDYCASCPVLAQCREIGLRLDTPAADGDMVRGGMSGDQLSAMRRTRRHRDSIRRAIQADAQFREGEDEERRRIRQLTTLVARGSLSDPRADRPSLARRRAAEAADELQCLRTARRQRAGWMRAA